MAASTVFLIGFMGSGKTTFGKRLAAKLKLSFIDLDEAICENQKIESIKALVDAKGIDFFRKVESEVLKKLNVDAAVISTGGGTPCYFDNLPWMKSKGIVVFLNLDEGVIVSRLKTTDLNERPLLKGLDEEGLKLFVNEKLAERMPFYSQADITFNPVVQKIEELLEQLS